MNPNTFDFQTPNEASLERLKTVIAAAKEYARVLAGYLPESRELSLALTKLEEAAMWANKAIVQNQAQV